MIKYDIKKIYEWPFTIQLIVLFAMGALVFYLGFISDIAHIRKNISDETLQETDLKSTFEASVGQRMTIQRTILQFPKLQATLTSWKKKIATDSEIPGILDNLLKMGEENRVKFNSFDPAKEIKDGLYFKVPVKIEMTGSYDDIANFISNVANLPKLIVIGNFTISKEAPTPADITTTSSLMLNSSTSLNGQLSLEIYRL